MAANRPLIQTETSTQHLQCLLKTHNSVMGVKCGVNRLIKQIGFHMTDRISYVSLSKHQIFSSLALYPIFFSLFIPP